MKRKRSQTRIHADLPILDRIQSIKLDHPLWGYRRVWAYLRFRENIVVGKNRIYRLMSEQNYLVQPDTKLKAKRCSSRKKPRAKVPNQLWGTDMTKVALRDWGWVYVHVVLDWYTKEIIGYHLSLSSKTSDWLAALNQAVLNRFPNGIHAKKGKPKLVTDNGCQPTSKAFMQACSTLKIRQIFTTWNNPKGNADTERVFRTMKEDLVWTHEWHLPFEFQSALDAWILNYNTDFPHQSLAYNTPSQFHHNFIHRKSKKKEVAQPLHSLILH
jgi:transposase InsO family protein